MDWAHVVAWLVLPRTHTHARTLYARFAVTIYWRICSAIWSLGRYVGSSAHGIPFRTGCGALCKKHLCSAVTL